MEVIEVFGWHNLDQSWQWNWDWFTIFCAATSRGRKRTMKACLEREEATQFVDPDDRQILVNCVVANGHLEILEWILHLHEIEGLPPLPTIPNDRDQLMEGIAKTAAYHGQKHILTWLKSQTEINEGMGRAM